MLSIEHSEVKPRTALITLKGKLMLGSDTGHLDALVGSLLETGTLHIVFDLAGLTHIDSTGIGRFIASYNKIMRIDGASLHMAGATGAVRAAFRVTKLDTVFSFVETVEAALASW